MFEDAAPELRGAGMWFIVTAIAFIVLGTFAIITPLMAGLAVATLVGWLLLAGGVMHAANAFSADSIIRAVSHVLLGILFVIAGLYFVAHPFIALGTLTIALACVLFFEAIMDLIAWFATRDEEGSGWLLVNAIATAFFSVLIWLQWPSVSVWAIGTLVGVKLMMSGISRLMIASTARRAWRSRSIS
jgi:uncharacterized membrane protein HdeD (DUF308 family)